MPETNELIKKYEVKLDAFEKNLRKYDKIESIYQQEIGFTPKGRLLDKNALITGGSSGIGAGVAKAFVEEGANVVIGFHGEEQKKNAHRLMMDLGQIKGKVSIIEADVREEKDVENLVNSAINEFGNIDILVNNAGISTASLIEDMTVSMWDQMLTTNLRSVFLCTRAILPHMYERNYGKIVNTASQLAYLGQAGFSHYTSAKAGIISFTRSLSREIGKRNINANCVAPGATKTPMLEHVDDEVLEAVRSNLPKGAIATIKQIVPAYVYLASDESSHMVGQTISPNGGDVML